MSSRTLRTHTADTTARLRAVESVRTVERRAEAEAPPPMAKPDLATLTAHYQQLLRLQDWRLTVSYARDLTDSAGNAVWGLCYPLADAKTATIIVRDPETPPPGETVEEALRQVTETVVHEITHLHFAPFGNRSPTAIVAEEQAVWALAGALVGAHGTPQEAPLARAVVDAASKLGRAVEPTTEPLRAAAGASAMLTLDELVKAAKALGFDGSSSVDEVMAKMKGEAAPDEEVEEVEPPMLEAAPQMAQPLAAAAESDDEPKEMLAVARVAMAIGGSKSPSEAMADYARCRAVVADLEKREAKVAADAKVLELGEFRRLTAEAVKLRKIDPIDAWNGDANGLPDGKTPAADIMALGLEKFRARVERWRAAAPVAGAPRPPAQAAATSAPHSDFERRMFVEKKFTESQIAAYVAKRDAIAARSGRKPAQET